MIRLCLIGILGLVACNVAPIEGCYNICDEKSGDAGKWIDCRKACEVWASGVSTPTPISTFWAAAVTKDNQPLAGFWTKVPMSKETQNKIQSCLEVAAIPEQESK